MKKYDLRELALFLCCALENLDVITGTLESVGDNRPELLDALSGSSRYLRILGEEITDRIDKLPDDVIKRLKEVS